MKYHKVIPAMLGVLTIKQLESLGINKGECFDNYDCDNFDYALPQDWLNDFANWCRDNRMLCGDTSLTYDLIRSTIIWIYPENEPCTCCHEVYLAFQKYESSNNE